ncbi:lysylphosphatidylglycerol synthase transmembrane domain-containing protein [Tenacibaculum sp. FZY0031]|uniref:lysylphosphatidylglycerol synthase transmembrane domain-containing protein n=1 Tax=unclassified Tenacibaculum TaxID=2635139 RepID=UPI002EA81C9F|nr:lysylphosphatidylglycerol synthase transmembrane domain-containing protein [Tenacibaculum sp. FZY0031]
MNKKLVKTLAKIGVSILLLYLVFTKIDFNQVIKLYETSNPFYLVLAISLFVISQLVSSLRLNYIFHHNQFYLSQGSNLKLYFVGMFYNFFIPGGVGGDAYKIYILNKQFGWKTKQLTKCVFVDRLIGLLAIFSLLILMGGYLFFFNSLLFLVSIIIALASFFIAKLIMVRIFKNSNTYYNYSFGYSLVIQLLQVGVIVCIIKAFQLKITGIISYCFVFLISSVLSVVSFAGFGAREYIFLKASSFLNTQETIATSIGLSFNIITALISLIGLAFIISKVRLTTVSLNT